MGDALKFPVPEENPRDEQELTECRLIEPEPASIYSVTGTLLRQYPGFCEIEIPDSDRTVISSQIMIQHRESDVTFTKKDLLFAARYQLSEIRLTGRSFAFSLRPGKAGWPDPEILARRYDEFLDSPEIAGILRRVSGTALVANHSWDPEVDILQVRNDSICNKIAALFHLDYQKTLLTDAFPLPGKPRVHFRQRHESP